MQRSELVKVGRLARIQLTEKEVDTFTQQIGSIIEYIHQLDQIDSLAVQPTTNILSTSNVFRADQIIEILKKEEALSKAPERDGDYFKTPKILGK